MITNCKICHCNINKVCDEFSKVMIIPYKMCSNCYISVCNNCVKKEDCIRTYTLLCDCIKPCNCELIKKTKSDFHIWNDGFRKPI